MSEKIDETVNQFHLGDYVIPDFRSTYISCQIAN